MSDLHGEPAPTTREGFGRVLVALYAIMAIGSVSRSVYAIATKFDTAPVAYTLSAVAAAVYVVATITLARGDTRSRRVAKACITFELVGVLVVGMLSVIAPALFQKASVWSWFGVEYLLLPLALPILGLWWLARSRPTTQSGQDVSV